MLEIARKNLMKNLTKLNLQSSNIVAMGFFKTLSKALEKATNPFPIRKKRWLPALDKFRIKGREVVETIGRILPFEQEKFYTCL